MHYDVIIAGGGLAGLGLAQQLLNTTADLRILVLERQTFPRPAAIAKVGESTVEIGSHYLAHRLGLQQHLNEHHLKKFGIRMFFGEPTNDLAELDELGASRTFGLPTYQIDRGIIENELAARVRSSGVTLLEAVDIQQLEPGEDVNTVTFSCNGESQTCSSKWLIDAAGRAALLKSRLNLSEKNAHKGNAVWFRVDQRIVIDNWSNNAPWHQRCSPPASRWLSTNHLTGPGYWLWIIPLASGVTSIGIVMDDIALAESAIADEASARAWLGEHQPQCAKAIEDANFLDFVVLKDYSYSCKQMFSASGWAITGEAGVFADPFYSPGSDFIAIGNDLIAELIRANFAGEDIRVKTLVFDKLYKSIYQNTLSLYVNQYGGFGDRVLMGVKLLWDYSYYWGVLSLLYYRGALTDLEAIKTLNPALQSAQGLNHDMQAAFAERAALRLQLPARGTFMDQRQIPCLEHFNRMLADEPKTVIAEELGANIEILNKVAFAVTDILKTDASRIVDKAERELLGEYRLQLL